MISSDTVIDFVDLCVFVNLEDSLSPGVVRRVTDLSEHRHNVEI